MFKIHVKAFVPAFLALALSAFIVTLAACGDSSGDNPVAPAGEESSSSSMPSGPVENDKVDNTISASLSVNSERVRVIVSVSYKFSDDTLFFDSVTVLLSKSNGSGAKKIGGTTTVKPKYFENDWNYTFDGKEFCGDEAMVSSVAYKDGTVFDKKNSEPFTRNKDYCDPPSSSSVSSSSVAIKQFGLIQTDFVLNSYLEPKGFNFASNDGGGTGANIYYEVNGNDDIIKAGSGTTIVWDFDFPESTSRRGPFYYSPGDPYPSEGMVANLGGSTADFPISRTHDYASSKGTELQYADLRYIMVRTNNASGATWTSNDYLVLFGNETTTGGAGGNRTIKITVWKTN